MSRDDDVFQSFIFKNNAFKLNRCRLLLLWTNNLHISHLEITATHPLKQLQHSRRSDSYTSTNMATTTMGQSLLLSTTNGFYGHEPETSQPNSNKNILKDIAWKNVLGFIYLHCTAMYTFIQFLHGEMMFKTWLWLTVTTIVTGYGITAGTHRLWAHKTYKATWQLRLLLAMFQSMAGQNHIYEWVRDHRVHHKFTDTDADPHNVKRGLFFSHMGWLMMKKHPDVKNKGKSIDMSDLDEDLIVVWQRRLYYLFMPLFCFLLPTWVPIQFWGEDPFMAWNTNISRYMITLHATWSVNSAAHYWGYKPYDKFSSSSENKYVSWFALGEGWHNFHHAFPWDYKTAELGNGKHNPAKNFIEFFAKIGWAYNLRSVSDEVIQARAARTGDGTLGSANDLARDHHHAKAVWGWDDPDLPQSERKISIQTHNRDD